MVSNVLFLCGISTGIHNYDHCDVRTCKFTACMQTGISTLTENWQKLRHDPPRWVHCYLAHELCSRVNLTCCFLSVKYYLLMYWCSVHCYEDSHWPNRYQIYVSILAVLLVSKNFRFTHQGSDE